MAKSTDVEPTTEAVTTQTGEEYDTRGQVVLATRPGHQFRPSNQELPVVTADGVHFTRANADAVLAEAQPFGDGYIREVKNEG